MIPIKVERAQPISYVFVEWKLHNVCNYNCSFCIPAFKEGNERWKPLSTYKKYVDAIIINSKGKKVWFLLSGGEPTLFPEFIELCKYIKEQGMYVSLISNGSRTIRWWEELRDSTQLDYLYITYHSEQTQDYQHVADVVNLFHDYSVQTHCIATHTIGNIDASISACEYFVKNTGSMINLRAMQIEGNPNFTVGYTRDQLENIKKYTWVKGDRHATKIPVSVPVADQEKSRVVVSLNNQMTLSLIPEQMRKLNLNKFKGWYCEAGIENMRINYDTVWRAGCVEGKPRLIDDNDVLGTLTFEKTGVICNATACSCAVDLPITKYKLN